MLVRFDAPFFGGYCAKHGADALIAEFFDGEDNLKQDAPEELRKEMSMIRGEAEIPDELWGSDKSDTQKRGVFRRSRR